MPSKIQDKPYFRANISKRATEPEFSQTETYKSKTKIKEVYMKGYHR